MTESRSGTQGVGVLSLMDRGFPDKLTVSALEGRMSWNGMMQ